METEAKYIVPDEPTFDRLKEAGQFGPYTRRDTHVKQVHDRYVDTEDASFYNSHLFARVREDSGGGLLLTLKRLGTVTEGAIHSREEYEAQVPGLDVAMWPESEARSLTQQIAGDKPLRDLFAIEQTRIVSTLYEGERAVAEMSLDDLTIQDPEGPVRSYELEVELMEEGRLADLHIMGRILTEQYALQPQPQSKFERAMSVTSRSGNLLHRGSVEARNGKATGSLGEQSSTGGPSTLALSRNGGSDGEAPSGGQATTDLSKAPAQPPSAKAEDDKIGVLPNDPAGVAGRKIIAYHFEKVLKNEEGTRKGEDPEALHDMRVATRRIRAMFRVLKGHLHGPELDDIKLGLRDLARCQGAVRDLDVLVKHATDFREHVPPEHRADLDALIDDWCKRRDRARDELLSFLDSKRYARLKKRVQSFVQDERADAAPPHDAEVEPYQMRHVAGSAIWDRYEAVRAYETVMDAPTVEQLHALRITGKYLRYTLECFREVLPPESQALEEDVTHLQDQLGELHDAVVASGLIRDWKKKRETRNEKGGKKSARGKGKKKQDQETEQEAPDGLTAYLQEREEAIRQVQEEFAPTWASLSSADWRSRLAGVVAQV